MTAIFAIIPEVLPSAGAGELVARFFANRSTIPSGAKLLAAVDLTGTKVANTNRIGAHAALREGDLVDLTGTKVTNASTFGANALQVQPAAGYLYGTKVGNTSTIGGASTALNQAPADGYLRATKVTNTSTFGSDVPSEAESSTLDDGDDMIGTTLDGTPL